MGKIKEKLYRALRWSEHYTKTDMVYLAKGGSWLTSGHFVMALSGFLLAILFANFLPKEIYGQYKFVLSITTILAIPTLSGMNIAVGRAVARGFDGSAIEALKTRFRWGLIAGVGSLFVAAYYFVNDNYILSTAFFLSAFFLPIFDIFTLYQSLLQGKKQFRRIANVQTVSYIVASTVMGVTIFVTNNLFAILLAYFVPWTLLRAYYFKQTIRRFIENKKTEEGTIEYGKHLTLMTVLGTIASHIDKILLFHFLGAAELAIYSIAIAIPEQIKGFVRNIATLAFPKFSGKKIDDIKNTLPRKLFVLVMSLVIIATIYILIAPVLFRLALPFYTESIVYSQIFTISIVSIALFIPVSILESQGETKKLYLFNNITAILQIVITLIFIVYFGLMGAVLGRVLVRFANLGISLILIKKT